MRKVVYIVFRVPKKRLREEENIICVRKTVSK